MSNIVCVLLVNMLVTRMLVTERAGVYFALWSLVSFIALVAQLGLRQASVKWIANALEKEDERELSSAIKTTTVMANLSFAIVVVLVLISIVSLRMLGMTTLSGWGIAFICIWVYGMGMQTSLAEIFRGYARHDLAGLSGGLVTNFVALITLIFIWNSDTTASLESVLSAMAIGVAVNGAMILVLIRMLMIGLPSAPLIPYRTALRTSLPMMAAYTSGAAIELLDTTILGAWGMHSAAGLYGAASRMAYLTLMPGQIMTSVIGPEVVAQHSKNNRDRLEKVIRSGSTLAFIPAICALALFLAFGDHLLSWMFQPAYTEAWIVLCILCFGNAISLWNASAAPALILTGHQNAMMFLTVSVAALCVACQFLLAPQIGFVGIAVVRAISLIILAVVMQVLCKRRLGVQSHSQWNVVKSITNLMARNQ